MQSEEQTLKRMKKNKASFREMHKTIEITNIRIMGNQKERRGKETI